MGTGRYEFRIEDSAKDGYGVMGTIRKKSTGSLEEEKYVGGGKGDSLTFIRNYSGGYYTLQLCTVDGAAHVK